MRALLEGWREEESGPRTLAVSYYPYGTHFYLLLLYLGGDIVAVSNLAHGDGTGAVVSLRFLNGDIGAVHWQLLGAKTPSAGC